MRVIALGDSITYGEHADPLLRWTSLLDGRAGLDVVNEGVCGDTTRLALERFPDAVQAIPPDVLLIQFGHNDCNRWHTDAGHPRVSREAFKANLHEMLDRAHAFGVLRAILISPHPTRRDAGYDQLRAAYAIAMHDVAAARSVSIVDVPISLESGNWQHVLMDGLHLSAEGHKLYAAAISRELLG